MWSVSQPSDTGGCATLISDMGFWTPRRLSVAGEGRLSQQRSFLNTVPLCDCCRDPGCSVPPC